MKFTYLSLLISAVALVGCGGGGGGGSSADATLVAQVVPDGYTKTVFDNFETKIIGIGSINIEMANLTFKKSKDSPQTGEFSVTYTVKQATTTDSTVLNKGSIEGTWSTPIASDRDIIIQNAEGENGAKSLQMIGVSLQVNEVHKDPLSSECTFVDGTIQIKDKYDTNSPYVFNLSGTETKLNYTAE